MSATTHRDYLSVHRKAAAIDPFGSAPSHPSPDEMEWLMELRGISRAVGTSWIIPFMR